MNDDDLDMLIAELLERPHERELILRHAELSDREHARLKGLMDTADAIWLAAQEAPAIEDDPVAAMLGLLPDNACRLDSTALSRARKRARLSVSDVAAQLQGRGWQWEKGDVFRWETRSAADVPPAVVQSIAEILGTPVEDLISAPSSGSLPDYVNAVRTHLLFEQLVARWAKARRVSLAVAAATLESRALATVHRGEHPDTEQLIRSLDALVASVEQTDGE
ncbi:hypothetical protein N3356_010955 [Micrococcus luteus]|nr:hypothetical protein [Micrococcus luteus]